MLIMSENTRQRGRNKDTEVESGDSAVMEELKALNAKMDRMQAAMDIGLNSKYCKIIKLTD